MISNSAGVVFVEELDTFPHNDFSTAETSVVGETYVALPGERILDSRAATQIGPYSTPWGPGVTRSVVVTGVGGVPATNVSAVVVHVTAVRPTAQTALQVSPTGTPPAIASVNAAAGVIRNDVVIATVDPVTGSIDITNKNGSVDVTVDVVGFVKS